jgi:CRISPR-associated protein Cmr4
MFTQNDLMFMYVETSLHAGTGRSVGSVDLPIQREKVTNYPVIQASSVKGRLRAHVTGDKDENDPEVVAIFGKAEGSEEGQSYAGAVSVGDAKLLLFPVRSLKGVFAWVTSADILARFIRDVAVTGEPVNWDVGKLSELGEGQCVTGTKSKVTIDSTRVVLEEFTFNVTSDDGGSEVVDAVAKWISENAFPSQGYGYWKHILPSHLVVLSETDFRDFTQFGTDIATHVKLIKDLKTVQSGALWTEECLPSETLLYSPIAMGASRQNPTVWSVEKVAEKVRLLQDAHVQLGGDETTGHGMVCVRFLTPGDKKEKNEVK